jgi:hypothetical protein
MTASREWTEYHLTPAGWMRGSEKTDFDQNEVTPPADRVLTMRYVEEHAGYSGSQDHEEVWRSEDAAEVKTLLDQHGPAPSHL